MPKKHKKPKLTKAQRALKKLEAKRKLRRDHLKREVDLGKVNLKQLEKKWRQLLLQIRMPEIKQDAELMWHRFERVLDVKDYLTSCLLDQIDDAETQYRYNFEANVEAINNVIATFRLRLAEMRDDYEREIKALARMADEDSNLITKTANVDETYIRSMLFNMNKHLETSDTQSKIDYLAATDELLNKNSDVRTYLRSALESRMDNMWGEFKGFLEVYDGTVGLKRKDYLEQKVHYDQTNQLIDDQLVRTQRLYRAVETARDRLVFERENQPLLLSDLNYEHKFFGDVFRVLKARLKESRHKDRELLRVMTYESNSAMTAMQKTVKKGENILKAGAVCRKLETQAEKVVPVVKPSEVSDQAEASETFRINVARCPIELMKMWDDFDDMRNFWLHVGTADARRANMATCVERLRAENRQLSDMLRAYLTGVARAGYQPDRAPGGSGTGGGGSFSGTEHAKHALV